VKAGDVDLWPPAGVSSCRRLAGRVFPHVEDRKSSGHESRQTDRLDRRPADRGTRLTAGRKEAPEAVSFLLFRASVADCREFAPRARLASLEGVGRPLPGAKAYCWGARTQSLFAQLRRRRDARPGRVRRFVRAPSSFGPPRVGSASLVARLIGLGSSKGTAPCLPRCRLQKLGSSPGGAFFRLDSVGVFVETTRPRLAVLGAILSSAASRAAWIVPPMRV